MIILGKIRLSIAAAATLVLLIVLTIAAAVVSYIQSGAEYALPFVDRFLVNEGFALIIALLFGIIAHFLITFLNRRRG